MRIATIELKNEGEYRNLKHVLFGRQLNYADLSPEAGRGFPNSPGALLEKAPSPWSKNFVLEKGEESWLVAVLAVSGG